MTAPTAEPTAGRMQGTGDAEAARQRALFMVDARLVRAGLTLVAVGSAVSAVGGLIVATALGAAARRWVRAQEVPPGEVAARRLDQLRAAMAAGTGEWRAREPLVHSPTGTDR